MYFEIYEGKSSKVSLTKEILTDVKEPLTGKISGAFEVDELKIGDKLKTEESLSYTFHLCGNTGLVNRTYHSFVLEINSLSPVVFNTPSISKNTNLVILIFLFG